jgi:hypothetical protein
MRWARYHQLLAALLDAEERVFAVALVGKDERSPDP